MADLNLDGVGKDFGATTAVDDVALRVASGESVVLLGPSGCGKTTTLRMIAGFERPTSGRITVGDTTVAGPGVHVPPERRDVGVVFQSYALWPHMTVAANVGFGLTVRRRRGAWRRDSRRAKVATALEQVQLGGLGDRYPHELSGGQQQRVALARALVTEPRVLLLDEPLSNLDSRLREDMRSEIRRLQQDLGITMVYITHDRGEALALADRVVVLREGRIQQIGPPEELYRRPCNRFVALALGPANFLPGTVTTGQDDRASVRLGNGRTVDARSGRESRPEVGETVSVCVRPADVDVRVADGPATSWTGEIRESVFLGDEAHHVVDVPAVDGPVRVVTRTAAVLPRGTRVELVVAPDAASLVDDPGAGPGEDTAGSTSADPITVPA